MNVEIMHVSERDRGVKVFAFEVRPTSGDAAAKRTPLAELAETVGRWRKEHQSEEAGSVEVEAVP